MGHRARISKQLEQSAAAGSIIVTDGSNEAQYLAPGSNGQVLTVTSGSPVYADGASKTVDVTQTGHGFTMPGRGFIPVYKNGSTWTLARANDADTLHQGFIVAIPDANTITMQFDGTLNAPSHGLTDDYYFLSSAAAGAVTATEPSAVGTFSAPVCSVIGTGTVHLRTNRPVGGSVSGANSGLATITSGNTSVTVAHGLASMPLPQNIKISFYQDPGNATTCWFENVTATDMDVVVNTDPAQTINISWMAEL